MRYALAAALALGLTGLVGCTNPNAIGVQVFGAVTVHCQRASDGSPVASALVSVGSTAASNTDANGNVTFPQVPAGPQTFIARAPGLTGSAQLTVVENGNQNVSIDMTASQ
jgi:hypothetical protein